jgi:hypothetical protein
MRSTFGYLTFTSLGQPLLAKRRVILRLFLCRLQLLQRNHAAKTKVIGLGINVALAARAHHVTRAVLVDA